MHQFNISSEDSDPADFSGLNFGRSNRATTLLGRGLGESIQQRHDTFAARQRTMLSHMGMLNSDSLSGTASSVAKRPNSPAAGESISPTTRRSHRTFQSSMHSSSTVITTTTAQLNTLTSTSATTEDLSAERLYSDPHDHTSSAPNFRKSSTTTITRVGTATSSAGANNSTNFSPATSTSTSTTEKRQEQQRQSLQPSTVASPVLGSRPSQVEVRGTPQSVTVTVSTSQQSEEGSERDHSSRHHTADAKRSQSDSFDELLYISTPSGAPQDSFTSVSTITDTPTTAAISTPSATVAIGGGVGQQQQLSAASMSMRRVMERRRSKLESGARSDTAVDVGSMATVSGTERAACSGDDGDAHHDKELEGGSAAARALLANPTATTDELRQALRVACMENAALARRVAQCEDAIARLMRDSPQDRDDDDTAALSSLTAAVTKGKPQHSTPRDGGDGVDHASGTGSRSGQPAETPPQPHHQHSYPQPQGSPDTAPASTGRSAPVSTAAVSTEPCGAAASTVGGVRNSTGRRVSGKRRTLVYPTDAAEPAELSFADIAMRIREVERARTATATAAGHGAAAITSPSSEHPRDCGPAAPPRYPESTADRPSPRSGGGSVTPTVPPPLPRFSEALSRERRLAPSPPSTIASHSSSARLPLLARSLTNSELSLSATGAGVSSRLNHSNAPGVGDGVAVQGLPSLRNSTPGEVVLDDSHGEGVPVSRPSLRRSSATAADGSTTTTTAGHPLGRRSTVPARIPSPKSGPAIQAVAASSQLQLKVRPQHNESFIDDRAEGSGGLSMSEQLRRWRQEAAKGSQGV